MGKPFDLTRRSYQFSRAVVLFITGTEFSGVTYPLAKQLVRSATSITANVIEGRSGNSRNVMINYYSIALRSSNETKYWLCLIRDTVRCDKVKLRELLQEAVELARILAKAIISLKSGTSRSLDV